MTYIVGWLTNYCCFIFSPRRTAALISVVTVGTIIALRGLVGTDVAMYTYMADTIQPGSDIEPMFKLILLGLTAICSNPQYAVTMGIGCLFAALLAIYAIRSDETELFILHAFYIPVFCYEQGINALRIGLACLLLMLGIQCYNRQQLKSGIALAACALLIQYTSIFLIAWWCLLTFRYRPLKGILLVLGGIVLLGCLALLAPVYLTVKWALYFTGTFQAPSSTSGLALVGGILIVLFGFILDKKIKPKVRYITVTLLLLMGCMGVTLISYAGLRFLNLLYITVVLGIVTLFQREGFRFGRRLRACIIFAGICGSIFTYKNFLDEKDVVLRATYGGGNSNSLPYKFFWE